MSDKKSKAALEKERLPNGKFAPGVSGNKRGRPKKEKPKGLPENWKELIKKDGVQALEVLLETATDRSEAAKLAKELAPFHRAKLSSVEAFSTEVKTIEIKWATDISNAPTIDAKLEQELLGIVEGEVEESIIE